MSRACLFHDAPALQKNQTGPPSDPMLKMSNLPTPLVLGPCHRAVRLDDSDSLRVPGTV